MKRLVLVSVLAACGGDDGLGDGHDATPAPDASACPREPQAADRERLVVVSHPFGTPNTRHQLLTLGIDGALADSGTTFDLGRSTVGEMAFTPDGEVGLVAQDDGTLGVVRFDGTTPVVVHAAFEGSFYADRVVMDPRGDRAYVIDGNTQANGGGIYRVAIGCDGALDDLGQVIATPLPGGMHALDIGIPRALVVASDVPDTNGPNARFFDLEPPAESGTGLDLFGDAEAIVGGSALTADGEIALVGDVSQFSGVPNRVAILNLDGLGTDILSPIEDPIAILASPFDDVALVVSGFGDAAYVLDRADGTFTLRGELTYTGAAPQLPGGAVMIDRGNLEGLVLIAENLGVRRVRMSGGGTVTDLGLFSLGAGSAAITGSIGVQP